VGCPPVREMKQVLKKMTRFDTVKNIYTEIETPKSTYIKTCKINTSWKKTTSYLFRLGHCPSAKSIQANWTKYAVTLIALFRGSYRQSLPRRRSTGPSTLACSVDHVVRAIVHHASIYPPRAVALGCKAHVVRGRRQRIVAVVVYQRDRERAPARMPCVGESARGRDDANVQSRVALAAFYCTFQNPNDDLCAERNHEKLVLYYLDLECCFSLGLPLVVCRLSSVDPMGCNS
jgi:hypothetical protein